MSSFYTLTNKLVPITGSPNLDFLPFQSAPRNTEKEHLLNTIHLCQSVATEISHCEGLVFT